MTALKNFAFEEHLVRVVERDGEPWFVGKDVCGVLGISDHHQALNGLDGDERGGYTVPTPSGEQVMVVVSEPGVYRLVFRSRKPEAERFKRWLAHDVLPAIRRTGAYRAPASEPFDISDTAISALRVRIDLVREARAIFGPQRAAELWAALDLPLVPRLPSVEEAERSDGDACLMHLLGSPLPDGRRVCDCLDDEDVLAGAGLGLIRPRTAAASWHLFVPNQHPALDRRFLGTRWQNGGWRLALIRGTARWTRGQLRMPGASRRGLAINIDDIHAIVET